MQITFGKTELTFKYTYLLVIIAILFTDALFLEFIFGVPDKNQVGAEEAGPGPEKYVIMAGFLISFLHINKLSQFLRNYLIFLYLLFLAFALESYYRSGSFFQYPHVFSRFMVFFLAFAVLPYFKSMILNEKTLTALMYIITIAFFANLILFRPYVLSFAAFVDIKRGFGAATTYLLLLPCIYFLNRYLFDKKIYHLLIFFAIISLIIFLQHRTVWIAMVGALVVNMLLLRKSTTTIPPSTLTPIFVIPAIGFFLLFSLVLSTNPEIIEKFIERIEDIQNADKQGTGSWRLQQFTSYLPFIEDNPLLGMRLEGFELPIQFFHEEAGIALFKPGTGHHFHSFYVDRVFYFGIFGLSVMVVPFIYIIRFAIKKSSFSLEEIVMISFTISGILYGLSYNLPTFFFGIMGITLGIIEARTSTIENYSTQDKLRKNEKGLVYSGK